MAGIGDYQGLCTEYEKDIEQKNKEIEQLKKEKEEFRLDNCKVNEERAHEQSLNMVKKEKIERLNKEKEWLINYYVRREWNRNKKWRDCAEIEESLLFEMQQALKEK